MITPLQNLPGIDTAIETVENEFLFGPNGTWTVMGIAIDANAQDANNTPTTTLRRGLILGKIAATGLCADYDPTQTDGTQEPVGILYTTTNLLDPRTGLTRQKSSQMVYWGQAKVNNLFGFDEYARRKLSSRIVFDDLRQASGGMQPANLTANYTALPSDNGKHFFWNGAAAGRITLPPPFRGAQFRISTLVDQTFQIFTGAGNMIFDGNVAAANATFQTASHKAGRTVELVATPNGSQYILLDEAGNSAAITIN